VENAGSPPIRTGTAERRRGGLGGEETTSSSSSTSGIDSPRNEIQQGKRTPTPTKVNDLEPRVRFRTESSGDQRISAASTLTPGPGQQTASSLTGPDLTGFI